MKVRNWRKLNLFVCPHGTMVQSPPILMFSFQHTASSDDLVSYEGKPSLNLSASGLLNSEEFLEMEQSKHKEAAFFL